jgi:hypothetical protein
MAEDCLWKLVFVMPVFNGSKSNVGGLAGDTKCGAPRGSCLTKAATAEWGTDTCAYNLSFFFFCINILYHDCIYYMYCALQEVFIGRRGL